MNGYLLDTSVALWTLGQPERLSPSVRTAVDHGPAWLSVISYWEVAIKSAIGKLDVGSVEDWWRKLIADVGAEVLPLRAEHVAAIARLPLLHRDPFDRALIGQAIAEDLELLSPDRVMAKYEAAGLKLLR